MDLASQIKAASTDIEHPEWKIGDALTYRDPETGAEEEGTFGGMRSQWLGRDIVLFETGVPGCNGRWDPSVDSSTGCWVSADRVRSSGTPYVKPFRW